MIAFGYSRSDSLHSYHDVNRNSPPLYSFKSSHSPRTVHNLHVDIWSFGAKTRHKICDLVLILDLRIGYARSLF